MSNIDTDANSERLRLKGYRAETGQMLISRLVGTDQEEDLTDPPNCGGLGRVRHFTRATAPGWPSNPLPIDPACRALGLGPVEMLRSQVFQNAICNWRCWYCFVPFNLLSGNQLNGEWFTAAELVDMYLALPDRPPVLDLSGGQPDLVPEWVPATLRALAERGIEDVYVWSDDNLSNDYFWRYLSSEDVDLLADSPRYGRVCCFKGFDAESFAFNTSADPSLFDRQFELFASLARTGMDVYAYATFTSANEEDVPAKMRTFVDRLQRIDEALPLRLIPLQITEWGPVSARMSAERHRAMNVQERAIGAWWVELNQRFTSAEIDRPITDVTFQPVGSGR